MQDGHPPAFLSKALGPKTHGLSTYEKEFMAILLAVQTWHAYLQFQEFTIMTDQRSLTQLGDQRLNTHWQQRVFSKLLGLQYQIVYRPSTDNRAADAFVTASCPFCSLCFCDCANVVYCYLAELFYRPCCNFLADKAGVGS